MPGRNEPGYNTLQPPGTRAHKAWSNLWVSITRYDVKRANQTQKYIRQIRRGGR